MKQVAFTVMAIIGILGTVLSVSQFVMACNFAEFGRVIVYFILAVLCIELAVASIIKLVKDHKANRT